MGKEKSKPSTNNLLKLAELFSCDVSEFLPSDKSEMEEKSFHIKQKPMFSIVGITLSFVLFVVGMLYTEQIPLLVIVGVLGLIGMWYFVFHTVGNMKNRN